MDSIRPYRTWTELLGCPRPVPREWRLSQSGMTRAPSVSRRAGQVPVGPPQPDDGGPFCRHHIGNIGPRRPRALPGEDDGGLSRLRRAPPVVPEVERPVDLVSRLVVPLPQCDADLELPQDRPPLLIAQLVNPSRKVPDPLLELAQPPIQLAACSRWNSISSSADWVAAFAADSSFRRAITGPWSASWPRMAARRDSSSCSRRISDRRAAAGRAG